MKLQTMYEAHKAELERVAEMTRDEAREELLAMVETETRQDMARRIREVEEETKTRSRHPRP